MSGVLDQGPTSTGPVPDPNDVDWVAAAGANPRTLRGTTSRTPHVAWTLLGIVTVPAAWYAWSVPGGLVLFAAIAASFVLWHLFGSRGSWMALVVIGLGMGGLLGWQAATGSRCPAEGTRVFLKLNKPSVDCAEIRASAATMSAFFVLVALLGAGAPLYARRVDRDVS